MRGSVGHCRNEVPDGIGDVVCNYVFCDPVNLPRVVLCLIADLHVRMCV